MHRVSGTPPVSGELAEVREVIAGLRAANARLRELLAERDARIGQMEAQMADLQAQVADLAARVKQNSENSSKPPSSDGLGKPGPKSLRKKTGRKPGRPKGQPGATMELTDHPDRVVRHEPGACAACGTGLAGAAQTGMERRQVTEIPPVKTEVTEHQMIEKTCPCCGERTKAKAPDGVNAPVQYGPRAAAIAAYLWHGQFLSRNRAAAALAEMFGCAPSPAVITAMARKIAGFISPAIDAIARALAASQVAHFDETGFRVAGKLAWVHSASAGKHVLVTVHAKRGKDGMDAAGILPAFAGIAVHDAWAPYDSYGTVAAHALCNAHILRELTAVTETGDTSRCDLGRAGDSCAARAEEGSRRRPRGRQGRDRPRPARRPREGLPRRRSGRDRAQRGPAQQAAEETARPGHPDARPRR